MRRVEHFDARAEHEAFGVGQGARDDLPRRGDRLPRRGEVLADPRLGIAITLRAAQDLEVPVDRIRQAPTRLGSGHQEQAEFEHVATGRARQATEQEGLEAYPKAVPAQGGKPLFGWAPATRASRT